MAFDGQRRQAIADHDAHFGPIRLVDLRGIGTQPGRVFGIELTAQVGPAQVLGAVGCATAHALDGPAVGLQLGFEPVEVERSVDGVTRHRVGPAKAQGFIGRHA